MSLMRIIYADTLVLLNFLTDYLLLLATGKICSLPLKRFPMALGASFGGLFALIITLAPRPAAAPIKLAGGFILVLIAFGKREFLRNSLVFMAVSAFFGGCQYAAAHFSGLGMDSLSIKTLLISFTLCYALLSLVFKGRARLGAKETAQICIHFRGEKISFTALKDTGNSLTDAAGRPVMIAEYQTVAPLFPAMETPRTKDALSMLLAMNELPNLKGRCQLFPCITAADSPAMLAAFRPDCIEANGRKLPHAYIAIVHTPLSSDGSFRAIF